MTAKPKALIITAWTFLLLASLLPKVILQEIFKIHVSEDLGAIIAGSVFLAGLLLTFAWQTVRGLAAIFYFGSGAGGSEWIVFTKVDQLPIYRSWLHNPSFSVYMLAEQSLRLLVTLTIIAVLFLMKKHAGAFFLAKGNTSAAGGACQMAGHPGGGALEQTWALCLRSLSAPGRWHS